MMHNKIAYNAIMNNAQKTTTGRMNAVIPVELIKVDPLYQRVEGRNERKLKKLHDEWDYNLMDPIKVVPHPETGDFYCVDGLGRLTVIKAKGELDEVDCIIIIGPEDPTERRKFEAKIFLRQDDCTDPIKPVSRHNALVQLGDETACVIEDICNKYGVKIMVTSGKREPKKLGSYSSTYKAVNADKENKRDNLEWIFQTINLSGFDKEANGYSAAIVEALYSIHKEYPSVGKRDIANYMRTMNTITFKSRSISKYPERYGNGGKLAMVLFLQDYIVETFGEKPVFDENGKKVIYMQSA